MTSHKEGGGGQYFCDTRFKDVSKIAILVRQRGIRKSPNLCDIISEWPLTVIYLARSDARISGNNDMKKIWDDALVVSPAFLLQAAKNKTKLFLQKFYLTDS